MWPKAGRVCERYDHLVNPVVQYYTTMDVKLAIVSLTGDLNVNLELEMHQETNTSFTAQSITLNTPENITATGEISITF